MAEILRKPIDCPAAWRGDQISSSDDWIYALSRRHTEEIEAALQSVKTRGLGLFEVEAKDFPLPNLSKVLEDLREVIDGGRGFALLRGLPVHRWTVEETEFVFWGLGRHMGFAEPQDAAGNRLHHVRDTGKDLDKDPNARGYETTMRLDYHIDGSDFFMLLCRRNAKQGGSSRLASAVEAFNEVCRRRPDLAEALQGDIYFDTRGQQLPGAGRFQIHPIYHYYKGHLFVIYKRGYIEFAQRFDEVPKLTDKQIAAMDLLDEICHELGFYLEFEMESGDIQIGSNHEVFHARTEYEDYEEPERKRDCLRLWLTHPKGRPLPPHYEKTREFAYSYARRMA